jgi:hypothetical protein
MKTKTIPASELNMPAAEFDRIMRTAFHSPAKAAVKAKAAPSKKPKKRPS